MCNYGRGHHEEHFCEITLYLDQCFRRRRHLKAFSYTALATPVLSMAKLYAILVESTMRNNSV